MFRIAIAEFKHETNTFSDTPTNLDSFRKGRYYVEGAQIIPHFRNVKSETGGFLKVLSDRPDVELIPVVAASAMPSGPVTQDVFDLVRDKMVSALRAAGQVDGVLLCLHGAMVTEASEDGEGDFLEAIRAEVGKNVPIIATLDLHANITEKMGRYADVLINFDSYPHSDMYDRGLEAATIMLNTLQGKFKPVMYCARRPLILPSMPTAHPAMKPYVDMAHAYEEDPRVVTVSISHGFFCADIYEEGLTVVAVTDNDPALAQKIAEELAEAMWRDRANLKRKHYTAEEAIAKAVAAPEGPVILADVTDNPGGGTPCDGTHLLRAMIAHNVQNAAVALIYDPESVEAAHKAGVGSTVHLRLGGKVRPEILGAPIECDAYVRLLMDGKYINKGPMGGGLRTDLHKSAVIVIGGIEVIIAANITQPYDTEIFRSHGIEPTDKKILVLKSTIHFRAHFEPLAKEILDVECPGLLPQNPKTLNYQKIRRPMYPLDEI